MEGYQVITFTDDTTTMQNNSTMKDNNNDNDDNLSDGDIAGIVIGCILFIIFVIMIIYYIMICNKSKTNFDVNHINTTNEIHSTISL